MKWEGQAPTDYIYIYMVNFFLATPTYAPMYLKIYEVSSQTKVSVPRDRDTPSSYVKEADLGG